MTMMLAPHPAAARRPDAAGAAGRRAKVPPAAGPPPPGGSGAAKRAALYAGGFLGPFGGGMVTVLIPELRDAFGVSTPARASR